MKTTTNRARKERLRRSFWWIWGMWPLNHGLLLPPLLASERLEAPCLLLPASVLAFLWWIVVLAECWRARIGVRWRATNRAFAAYLFLCIASMGGALVPWSLAPLSRSVLLPVLVLGPWILLCILLKAQRRARPRLSGATRGIVLISATACAGVVASYAWDSTNQQPAPRASDSSVMDAPAEGPDAVAADQPSSMRIASSDPGPHPYAGRRVTFVLADGSPAVGLTVIVERPESPRAAGGAPRERLLQLRANSDGEVLLDASPDPAERLTVLMSDWVVLHGALAAWCRQSRIVLPQLAGASVSIAPRLTSSELLRCRFRIEQVGGAAGLPTIPGVRVRPVRRTLPVPDSQQLHVSGLIAGHDYDVGIECLDELLTAEPARVRPPAEATITVRRTAVVTLNFLEGESGQCVIYTAEDESARRLPAARAVLAGECLVPMGALVRDTTYFIEAIGPGWASVDGHSFVAPGVATTIDVPTNPCRAVRIEFRGLEGEPATAVTTTGGRLRSAPQRDSGDGAGAIVSSNGDTWWISKNGTGQGPRYYFVHPTTHQVVPHSFPAGCEAVVVTFSRSEVRAWREGLDFARRSVAPSMAGSISIEVALPDDQLVPWYPIKATSLQYGWDDEEWWQLGFGAGQRYRLRIVDNRSGSRLEFVSHD